MAEITDAELARAIFLRDHHHLIVPLIYDVRDRGSRDAALLQMRCNVPPRSEPHDRH